MAVRAEGWKSSGLVRGIGIPAPSGPRLVGCVDLMHRLEGREDSLLVRLFYPTAPDATGEYARWTPHRRYTKGYLDFFKTKASGLIAAIAGLFTGAFALAVQDNRLASKFHEFLTFRSEGSCPLWCTCGDDSTPGYTS